MVNSCAVCGCCTRTDIVREHLEDTLRICDVSAKGLYISATIAKIEKATEVLTFLQSLENTPAVRNSTLSKA